MFYLTPLLCERRVVHTGFRWGTGGKKKLGRPRYRWEDNIESGLEEIGLESVQWIDLA